MKEQERGLIIRFPKERRLAAIEKEQAEVIQHSNIEGAINSGQNDIKPTQAQERLNEAIPELRGLVYFIGVSAGIVLISRSKDYQLNEKSDRARWVESQRLIKVFCQPGKLSREMRKKMDGTSCESIGTRIAKTLKSGVRRIWGRPKS